MMELKDFLLEMKQNTDTNGRYILEGYEKDGDYYETYYQSNNLEDVIVMGIKLMPYTFNNTLKRIDNNQPIDWIEIYEDEIDVLYVFCGNATSEEVLLQIKKENPRLFKNEKR